MGFCFGSRCRKGFDGATPRPETHSLSHSSKIIPVGQFGPQDNRRFKSEKKYGHLATRATLRRMDAHSHALHLHPTRGVGFSARKKKAGWRTIRLKQTLRNTRGREDCRSAIPDRNPKWTQRAAFFAVAFTCLVKSVAAAFTCFLKLSLANSKLPLAIWLSASPVLTVTPSTS